MYVCMLKYISLHFLRVHTQNVFFLINRGQLIRCLEGSSEIEFLHLILKENFGKILFSQTHVLSRFVEISLKYYGKT
jgi:hypothetical protein